MSDALERLKKRQRPTVPPRDASLITNAPHPPQINTSTSVKPQTPTSSKLEPGVGLQTKQSTLRLEQGVSDRLQAVARSEGLCREVLIEAMFEYCEAHPEAMQSVIEESKTKNDHRQQIANLKRAKSMMQRFGNAG
ncbi:MULTISPECIES: hypothetical protein [unclassified Leptolyngbya]|uniref:hypothetical protein n=1 Tax=unclassified Leptolyngbya TaxID=2650499 RepID=UPI0016884156|nr:MULTISPECIES: hypothetical protein [unclassified Leptolyngbya]MBD1910661.1 hypothetical protein [Leptolyngbya sp. FACHB-8]MBD2158416.1 hypothetical protein [Leptolyngbya sp. FACHB-16]